MISIFEAGWVDEERHGWAFSLCTHFISTNGFGCKEGRGGGWSGDEPYGVKICN